MTGQTLFRLTGVAMLADGSHMLDEICDHFVEHGDVQRTGDTAILTEEFGTAVLRLAEGRIDIELSCSTQAALDLSRNDLAEHMFYFAGAEPLDLVWRAPPSPGTIPNLHAVTVVSAHDITPRMRRVVFQCADISPFIGGEIHARLLVPPQGRSPIWPGYRPDGRIDWPEGDDAMVVRPYTIRAVNAERGELSIDFLQHPASHGPTPGADFARDARPGHRAALLGPGSGGIPQAGTIFLAGDESALPAIARIVEEAPAGTVLKAIIEVEDAAEERYLPASDRLDIRWLHRSGASGGKGQLAAAARTAIEELPDDAFVFIACEKQDVRELRTFLKRRGHERGRMYVAWYWEKQG